MVLTAIVRQGPLVSTHVTEHRSSRLAAAALAAVRDDGHDPQIVVKRMSGQRVIRLRDNADGIAVYISARPIAILS
jgi:hypothetical protein